MSNTWDQIITPEEKQEKAIKKIRYSISAILAIAGILLLASQLLPLAQSYLTGLIYDQKEKALAAPIPSDFQEARNKEFGFDPGKSYFANLIKDADIQYNNALTFDPVTKQMKPVTINDTYSTPMKITIATAQINNIKVTPNVNSYDETIYNQTLKSGLAHFKGTPLPGDGGNAFIYGHSSVPSFFNSNQNNPEVVFSKLDSVEIGNQIAIEKDGKNLYYTVRKKKLVEPNDISILKPQNDKETVTLMTCWPLGIGSKRLIVIAERNE